MCNDKDEIDDEIPEEVEAPELTSVMEGYSRKDSSEDEED